MTTPAPPAGFVMEGAAAVPPPPPGFELDTGAALPARATKATPAPKQRTVAQELGRSAGLGARALIRGAGDIVGIVADPFIHGANMLGANQATLGEASDRLSNALGLPQPETPVERVSGGVTSALAGGGGLIGLGRGLATRTPGVVRAVGEALASQPATQLAGAVGGSGASGLTREAGGGEGAQLIAGLAGGLSPAAIKTGGSAAVRGAVRGGEAGRKELARNTYDFRMLGAEPSVGQASGNRVIQGAENLLAASPTSTGVLSRAAERQADAIGGGLRQMADDFVPNASAERAGRAIEEGIKGEEGFAKTTRAVADKLYQRVDEAIPKDSRVDVTNTRTALADLNSMIEGAPSVSRFFQNARLEGIERGLLSDVAGADAVLTQPGMREQVDAYRQYLQGQAAQAQARNVQRQQLGMKQLEPVATPEEIEANVTATLGNMVDNRLPYEALQKLRTLVGNEIEGSTLLSDVPRSKWKALYGALSRDMEEAATTPEAKQALSRANRYFNARVDRLDTLDRVIDRNGGPEKIFSAVMSGTRDGGTTLRSVMQSLPQEGQEAVTAAVIKRMGLANPGQQGAEGADFSAQTFLTNWNKVSPEARRALFDRHGPKFTANMDRIARVAENIRDGSRVYANPSGTANRAAALTYGASLGAAILSGQLQVAAGLGAGGGIANVAARALNNPRFVSWLARATEAPVSTASQQILQLKAIASSAKDDELREIAEDLEEQARNQQANGNDGAQQ